MKMAVSTTTYHIKLTYTLGATSMMNHVHWICEGLIACYTAEKFSEFITLICWICQTYFHQAFLLYSIYPLWWPAMRKLSSLIYACTLAISGELNLNI